MNPLSFMLMTVSYTHLCRHCNRFKADHLEGYRVNLIAKIGQQKFDLLKVKAAGTSKVSDFCLLYTSKTGRFTANQEKLAKEIAIRIAKLRKSGCYVFGNGDRLHVYKIRDIEHEQPLHLTTSSDYNHPLKYLEAGHINDSGAGDILFFEPGYITEE